MGYKAPQEEFESDSTCLSFSSTGDALGVLVNLLRGGCETDVSPEGKGLHAVYCFITATPHPCVGLGCAG